MAILGTTVGLIFKGALFLGKFSFVAVALLSVAAYKIVLKPLLSSLTINKFSQRLSQAAQQRFPSITNANLLLKALANSSFFNSSGKSKGVNNPPPGTGLGKTSDLREDASAVGKPVTVVVDALPAEDDKQSPRGPLPTDDMLHVAPGDSVDQGASFGSSAFSENSEIDSDHLQITRDSASTLTPRSLISNPDRKRAVEKEQLKESSHVDAANCPSDDDAPGVVMPQANVVKGKKEEPQAQHDGDDTIEADASSHDKNERDEDGAPESEADLEIGGNGAPSDGTSSIYPGAGQVGVIGTLDPGLRSPTFIMAGPPMAVPSHTGVDETERTDIAVAMEASQEPLGTHNVVVSAETVIPVIEPSPADNGELRKAMEAAQAGIILARGAVHSAANLLKELQEAGRVFIKSEEETLTTVAMAFNAKIISHNDEESSAFVDAEQRQHVAVAQYQSVVIEKDDKQSLALKAAQLACNYATKAVDLNKIVEAVSKQQQPIDTKKVVPDVVEKVKESETKEKQEGVECGTTGVTVSVKEGIEAEIPSLFKEATELDEQAKQIQCSVEKIVAEMEERQKRIEQKDGIFALLRSLLNNRFSIQGGLKLLADILNQGDDVSVASMKRKLEGFLEKDKELGENQKYNKLLISSFRNLIHSLCIEEAFPKLVQQYHISKTVKIKARL